MTTVSDGLSQYGGLQKNVPQPVEYAIPRIVRVNLGAPTVAAANNISLSQSVSAGVAALLNGTLGAAGVATLDVPRNVVAAWTGAAVITVKGTDQYNQAMSESTASGTSFTGKKAFKTVTSVTFSANVTLATVGTGVVLGLPYVMAGLFDVITIFEANTNTTATATVVAADLTSPATKTTGDVRGTLSGATPPDGTIVYRIYYNANLPTSAGGQIGVTQA